MEEQSVLVDGCGESEIVLEEGETEEQVSKDDEPYDLADRLYEEWIAGYDMGEVLILDSDRLDFVSDLIDRHDVRQRIEKMIYP